MFSISIVKAWGINWTNFRHKMSIQLFICGFFKVNKNYCSSLLFSFMTFCIAPLLFFVLFIYFYFCIASLLYFFAGWEFYHENSLRAASASDFWKRVTGKEGVTKRWRFPLLLFVWVFFIQKMCFIGLRSRASLSIFALRGRQGRYAHAYGICATFYCIILKEI